MKLLYAFGLLALVLFSACQEAIEGNGNVVSEKRILKEFQGANISGVFDVIISKGDPSIEIRTDENLIPFIRTDVEGDLLAIHTEDKLLNGEVLELRIACNTLEELTLNGALNVETVNLIQSEEFELELNGAGEVDLALKVEAFYAELNGGGELYLKGEAVEAQYEINGAGDIEALEFYTKTAAVDVAGAGDARLNVADELEVEVSGASDIKYLGNPEVTQKISGAGSVSSLEK